MHQIEAVLNYADGRDRTPPEQWNRLLFWGKFVGSDKTHKIVRPGCGWAHYPPNAESDYDWANPRYVETDIEDWKPDGTGKRQRMNCDRWDGSSVKWFEYWMQSLPGARNGLKDHGVPLTNWWIFIGDYDGAVKNRLTLTGGPQEGLRTSSDRFRIWTDSTGKHHTRAALLRRTGDSVELRKYDGKRIRVPLETLSLKDQEHLKLLSSGKRAAPQSEGAEPDRQ
jgi:hypothetical protein